MYLSKISTISNLKRVMVFDTLFLPDCPDAETRCWELAAGKDWVGMFNMLRTLRRQFHFPRQSIQSIVDYHNTRADTFVVRLTARCLQVLPGFKHIILTAELSNVV